MQITNGIPNEILEKFEFFSYNHAFEILTTAYPDEWQELLTCLNEINITVDDIKASGGNESRIPKKFDTYLYPHGWREIRITGDLLVKYYMRQADQRTFPAEPYDQKTLEGYIDGHNIDFLKGEVAFDLEWNSKDQTFDRDLLAMRTYYDTSIIGVGVIVTRSGDLNELFKNTPDENGNMLIKKYGASTTWMGKLLYRLESRRNGGCPILAVGIKRPAIGLYDTEE